jgi:toxin ParE1/3/4
MLKLVTSRLARSDAASILRWIAKDNPRAAKRMLVRITAGLERLSDFPDLGVARDDLAEGVRAFVEHPYLIIYRHQEDRVEILRILHGARDLSKIRFKGSAAKK